MVMRRKLVAGNWKMNQDTAGIKIFASELKNNLTNFDGRADMLICPPFIYLPLLQELFNGTAVAIGAQNVASEEKGAFTGEVSAVMLKDLALPYCIIGHSERRQYYHESDELLVKKIKLLFANGIRPVFCCGEMLPEREAGNHFNIVQSQLEGALWNLSDEMIKPITIAYEPVWAIGTGVTATPAQAQEMHAFIRQLIEKRFGSDVANNMRILYGGSVTPDNAAELFSMPDIDGGLVGGASLKAESFTKLINSCK